MPKTIEKGWKRIEKEKKNIPNPFLAGGMLIEAIDSYNLQIRVQNLTLSIELNFNWRS